MNDATGAATDRARDGRADGLPVDLEDAVERLFRDGRTNAVLAWLLVGVLGVAFVESVHDVDYGWTLFVGAVSVVVLLLPLAFYDWRVMLPWELLVVALFPILVRAAVGGRSGRSPPTSPSPRSRCSSPSSSTRSRRSRSLTGSPW